MGECTLQCTQFEETLALHIISKVITCKILDILNYFKDLYNNLGFKIKGNPKNYEYEI